MSVVVDTAIRSFDKLFVGGSWIEPSTSERIKIISPFTEEVIGAVPAGGTEDVDTAVAAARVAFDSGIWPTLPASERAALMHRVADEIEKRIPEMVKSFTAEVGAPTAVSQSFHEMAPALWRRSADLITRMASEDARAWDGGTGLVVREPVGVVGAVVPWNGPVANVSLKMAPAVGAGCSIVVKPAWEGPASTFLLAEALDAAGLPEGLVSIIPGGRELGEHLVGHRDVDKVTFTGSTAAGRRVMEVCARRIARVTLELGGKSAGIIAEDADLDEAVPSLVGAGIGHSGQVCAAITRILAPRKRYDEVVDALGAAMSSMKVGDPFDPATAIGPLVAERQRDRVEEYIQLGRDAGARVVVGGGRPAGLDRGWFVEPTLFADVDNGMRIAREEIFGPVLVVIPYEGIDEAIAIANDSEYGLSGAVFTADPEYGRQIARRVRTGQIYVNSAGICTAEPFGGFKQSGLGREGGAEGIGAFLETKLIAGGAA